MTDTATTEQSATDTFVAEVDELVDALDLFASIYDGSILGLVLNAAANKLNSAGTALLFQRDALKLALTKLVEAQGHDNTNLTEIIEKL